MNQLKTGIKIGAIYDSDYWSEEQLESIYNDLQTHLEFTHIFSKKEIENYLLVPKILDRLLKKLIAQNSRKKSTTEPDSEKILENLTSQKEVEVQSQYIAKYCQFFKASGKDQSTLTQEALTSFKKKWTHIDSKLGIVPGKKILSEYRNYISDVWGISLSEMKIIAEFKQNEIDEDMIKLIGNLDTYRKNRDK